MHPHPARPRRHVDLLHLLARVFLLTVGKYLLQGHVLSDVSAPDSPDWVRMDCILRTWHIGTVSGDLADAVTKRAASARAIWLAMESQFLGNQETRALFLTLAATSYSPSPICSFHEICFSILIPCLLNSNATTGGGSGIGSLQLPMEHFCLYRFLLNRLICCFDIASIQICRIFQCPLAFVSCYRLCLSSCSL